MASQAEESQEANWESDTTSSPAEIPEVTEGGQVAPVESAPSASESPDSAPGLGEPSVFVPVTIEADTVMQCASCSGRFYAKDAPDGPYPAVGPRGGVEVTCGALP